MSLLSLFAVVPLAFVLPPAVAVALGMTGILVGVVMFASGG